MGMLLAYHRAARAEAEVSPAQDPGEYDETPTPEVAATYNPEDADNAESPEDPAGNTEDDSETDGNPETDPYAELTDDQVADAYATNVGGRATKRETQEAALRELDTDASE